MKDLISVIIPVYNVEEYLRECLDSLINQTYKNIEVILVDDGSKDNSGSICDEYAEKDKRIKVIHKENGGVSKARNVALDIAQGTYITFLDSDDYLYENGIEILYDLCVKNKADISIGGVQDVEDGKNTTKGFEVECILNTEEGIKAFLEEKFFQCVIWSKMYRREVIKDERFDEKITIAEDFDFLYRVLKNSEKISVDTNQMVYHYRVRTGSLMRQKYNKKFENEIDLSEKVLEDVRVNYPNIENSAIRRYQRITISCIAKYYKENDNIDGVRHLVANLKKYPLKIDMFLRVKMFSLLYAGWFFKLVYVVMRKIKGV